MGPFVASADVEGAFDCIKHDDVEGLCCKKVFILNPSALFCANPVISRVELINLPGAPMSHAFLYARGARQGSVEGPDMWNQVLDSAL